MKKIITVCAATVFLTACVQNPNTGAMGTGVSNSALGAGIGAAAGAGIGALVGGKNNKGQAALIGAAAGAALGGSLGYYMDSQQQELVSNLQGTPMQVQRQGNDLSVVVPGNVAFATNSATINPAALPALDSVAGVLVKSPNTTITVAGYTDAVGSADANLKLSAARAESVGRYLVSKGVAAQRIQATGFGNSNPIASNDNEAGRAQNRRVEIKIHPVQQ